MQDTEVKLRDMQVAEIFVGDLLQEWCGEGHEEDPEWWQWCRDNYTFVHRIVVNNDPFGEEYIFYLGNPEGDGPEFEREISEKYDTPIPEPVLTWMKQAYGQGYRYLCLYYD